MKKPFRYSKNPPRWATPRRCAIWATYTISAQGTRRDTKKAAEYFAAAATAGSDRAKFDIGRLYYRGHGVERDLDRAARHFREAAQEGYARAQLFLGIMYSKGQGVAKDPVEAYFWLTLAQTEEKLAGSYLANLEGILSRDEIDAARKRAEAFRPE